MSKIAINSFKFRFFPLFIRLNFVFIASDSNLEFGRFQDSLVIPSPKKEATGKK